MQTTINNNLEERIVALEATVMQLQQQLIALMPVVIVPEPETEVEPVSDVCVLSSHAFISFWGLWRISACMLFTK